MVDKEYNTEYYSEIYKELKNIIYHLSNPPFVTNLRMILAVIEASNFIYDKMMEHIRPCHWVGEEEQNQIDSLNLLLGEIEYIVKKI